MLRWPTRAKAAVLALFQPLQDVDVYVEDADDEVFYRALLQRLSGTSVRIARVLGLGGRSAVVAAATAHPLNGRPALYIVDGDLEWVRGDPAPLAPSLLRLDAYCIENLIFCEQAIAHIVAQDVVLSPEDAKRAIGLEAWLADISDPLVDLFAVFATSNRMNPPAATVSMGVGVLCQAGRKGRPQELARAKVERAKKKLLADTIAVAGEAATLHLYGTTLARARALPRPMDTVSGKDFLLPLLNAHLNGVGCRVSRKALRMRLAGACRTERLSELRGAILSQATKRTL